MPRTRRTSVGGLCYHGLSRGNRKSEVFHDTEDYRRFMVLVARAHQRIPVRVLAWCLMPNHFHFVLWPREDGDMSSWMHWLLTCHVKSYHDRYGTSGRVWQGRFKSFAIEDDLHLLRVLRYVDQNPLRAKLVGRAEEWSWSSLSPWIEDRLPSFWNPGPVSRPSNWDHLVNTELAPEELKCIRQCVNKERPYGSDSWTLATAARLDLMWTLRGPGRPRAQ